MESEKLYLEWIEFHKWVKYAEAEVIQRFNLKPPEGYPNYPNYCFVKKNTNRYFRKHLGFTINMNLYITKDIIPIRLYTIVINDRKKLMIFRLKYEI